MLRRRAELFLVIALTLVGAILRFWHPGRVGLTHFDEGIYTFAGTWSLVPQGLANLNPSLIPYAPPGFPILIGASHFVFGMSDLAAIFVAQVAGVLTIPVVAWLGRRTFGPGAGAAAAAFAAMSGPHVAFSRMALTDAPFLLAWLVALGLGMRFLERPGLGRSILFGLAVGLAQNLKYNGWLAGVIVSSAAVIEFAWLSHRDKTKPIRWAARAFGFGLIAAVIAGTLYLPWYAFVERHGGYAKLVEHHRGYLGGLATWPWYWRSQMDQSVALAGGPAWGMAAWGAAWLAGLLVASNGPRRWARVIIGGLAPAAVLAVAPNLPWWVGLAILPWLMIDARPAAKVLAVCWLVMSVMTPFYHPYARLWLPLHAAGWLVMGGVVAAGLSATRIAEGSVVEVRCQLLSATVALSLAIADVSWFAPGARPLPDLLGPTDSTRRAVARIVERLPDEVRGVRLVSRPHVLFYLNPHVPVQSEEASDSLLAPGPPGVWAIVEEEQLRQEGDVDEARSVVFRRWEPVAALPVEPSLPALLDADPGAARGDSPSAQGWIWVVRPRRGP